MRIGVVLLLCLTYLLLHRTSAQAGTTTRVSVDRMGYQANSFSASPSISDNGRFVAFSSSASNLVPDDTNETEDIFVHDRQTGQTTRVSVDSLGQEANSHSPELRGDASQPLIESRLRWCL